jgi:hypothetical protein
MLGDMHVMRLGWGGGGEGEGEGQGEGWAAAMRHTHRLHHSRAAQLLRDGLT